jgi:hypothetical protein
MNKKTVWLSLSCLIVAALLLASCAPPVEEEELGKICQEHGFRFESLPNENGALLYFRGILQQ